MPPCLFAALIEKEDAILVLVELVSLVLCCICCGSHDLFNCRPKCMTLGAT